ncbi:MAG: hypothetical protein ACREGB_00860, partial [Candidatus Saccharimonadales bacterium]
MGIGFGRSKNAPEFRDQAAVLRILSPMENRNGTNSLEFDTAAPEFWGYFGPAPKRSPRVFASFAGAKEERLGPFKDLSEIVFDIFSIPMLCKQ